MRSLRTIVVTIALLALGFGAAPAAEALSVVQHALPKGYEEAIAIYGYSGGLLISTAPTGTVYNRVTTSPFAVTPGPAGVTATSIATGPGGVPWVLGSERTPTTAASKEHINPALYEANPSATPATAVLRYEYPTIWNAPFGPTGLALGPDGALWIADPGTESVERYVPGGTPEPHTTSPPAHPASIVSGPGDSLWFTDTYRGAIGQVSTAGAVSERLIENGSSFGEFGFSGPYGIAAGPEEALWFTEQNTGRIGRITTSGQLTEYAIPNPGDLPTGAIGAPAPRRIVYGPEGAFWFTDPGDGSIGRITTAGQVTEYKIPSPPKPKVAGEEVSPDEIAVAGNGELWFTESGVPDLGSVDLTGTEATTTTTKKAKASGAHTASCRAQSAGKHRQAKARRRRALSPCRAARRRRR